MDGNTAVLDGNGKMTNEGLGGLTRRFREIERRINEGDVPYQWAMEELQRVIEGRPVGDPSPFKTFRTIQVGNGPKNANAFRKLLKQKKCRISDWANDIIGKPAFTVVTEQETLELVVVSVAELGFPKGANRKDIYDKALSLGLSLCPPEVGPQLRLQYLDQPLNEWLLIGMEPIAYSGGYLLVFRVVRHEGGLWLNSDYGYPDNFWNGSSRWVFVRK